MTTTSLLLSPQGSSQPQNPLDKAVSQAAESSAERWLPNLDLWIEQAIGVAALIVIGVLILLATRALRMLVIRPLIQRTKNKWDDVFVDQAFFRWISYMPPTLICSAIVEQMPGLDPSFASAQPIDLWIHQILTAATTLTGMLAIGAIVDACHELWRLNSKNRGRSIKGYISLIKLFVYILGTVAAVAFLFGRDPTGLLAGLGAMTAVLLLVFKDTILSLVASITLTQNDMIRLGDWIEVPGAADGDVVDMALHTVKIQNFDRTISTIPTIQLVDRPFKNWRNMSDGPGRRIKRSLFLDSASVRFLTEEEVARFGEIALLKDYIGGKQQDLAATNKACDPAAAPLDVRRLTNLG
ncbi:MAG: mechanosensitive ion channel domain-containing protein, partial [Planctomycetota bacterium]|nr:mechanosensitive ion channel domain-containing protein [Planctomycetota bacterium]